jgi:Protein of unknown function (DUF1659).
MSELVDSRLQIRYFMGNDENGRKQTKTVTYSGVKTSAADEQLLSVATKIAGLSSHPVDGLLRVNTVGLA